MALQTSNETYEKPHLCGSATECGSSIGVQTTKDCLECVFRKTHFKELCSFALRSNNTNLQRYLLLCDTTWRCSGANSQFCSPWPPNLWSLQIRAWTSVPARTTFQATTTAQTLATKTFSVNPSREARRIKCTTVVIYGQCFRGNRINHRQS